jgi:hypothetical protein
MTPRGLADFSQVVFNDVGCFGIGVFEGGGNEADPSRQPAESCSSHGDLKKVPPVPRSSVLPAVGDGVFSVSAYLLGGKDADPAHQAPESFSFHGD